MNKTLMITSVLAAAVVFLSHAHADDLCDKRKQTAQNAQDEIGNEDYSYDGEVDDFPPNTWKCNKFVEDMANNAGATVPEINDGWPPQANDWAREDREIPGWEHVTDPKPGDVAALENPDGLGHTGIVGPDGEVIAATKNGVEVDPTLNNPENDVKYRRYTGPTPEGENPNTEPCPEEEEENEGE